MNQGWVQQNLGVPLNFSISSNSMPNTYFGVTGDPIHVSIDVINFVAQSGIKVVLVFGDRDYRCNCTFCPIPLFPSSSGAGADGLI